MKRVLRIATVAAVFAAVLMGCGGKKKTKDPWKEYTYRAHGFSVMMPAEPEYSTQTAQSVLGDIKVHMYLVEHGVMAYGVMINEVPGEVVDLEESLDNARNGAVRTSGGSLISEKKISLAGNPGREIQIKTAQNMTYTAHLYMVGTKLYQVMAMAPAGVDASEAIAKFVDSFKFL